RAEIVKIVFQIFKIGYAGDVFADLTGQLSELLRGLGRFFFQPSGLRLVVAGQLLTAGGDVLPRYQHLPGRIDFHEFERLKRALRIAVEGPDRVDLRAEELDPVGFLRIGRKNVDDAAADTELSLAL